jgi:hypothetical protein
MKRGEIFRVKTPHPFGYRHSFVFWDDNGGSYLGLMLTHSDQKRYADNIPLEDVHFDPSYKFQNENTYFVQCMLIKDIPAIELEKCGELTDVGIKYIDSHMPNMRMDTWGGYLKKNQP